MAMQLGKKILDDAQETKYTNALNETCTLFIARAGSTEYLKVAQKVERPFKKLIEKDRISIEKRRELNIRILAESILKGWKDVVDSEGNEIEYTVDLGIDALNNDSDMMEFIMDYAIDSNNFINQEVEIAKKSIDTLDGVLNTETD